MIELPESAVLAHQAEQQLTGKRVERVLPPNSPHRFCWFEGPAETYHDRLAGRTVTGAAGAGMYVRLDLSDGAHLAVNDGVNLRYLAPGETPPAKYQLLIRFEGGDALCFTVAMYGGILAFCGDTYDNEYYLRSFAAPSPLTDAFTEQVFREILAAEKKDLSAKALLATGQRIPGLGNGVLQDILLRAGVHPRRKVSTLSEEDVTRLYASVRSVLADMTAAGGRDTERDLFGRPGGYRTVLGRHAVGQRCPVCGEAVVEKAAYLGGSVYFCPHCQPLA